MGPLEVLASFAPSTGRVGREGDGNGEGCDKESLWRDHISNQSAASSAGHTTRLKKSSALERIAFTRKDTFFFVNSFFFCSAYDREH
jgi:hypothetical protein